MASAITAPNLKMKSTNLLIAAIVVLTLGIAGYSYYSLTHHSIDLFSVPNPAKNLHQQKPISTSTPSNISIQ